MKKVIVGIVVAVLVIGACIGGYHYFSDKNKQNENNNNTNINDNTNNDVVNDNKDNNNGNDNNTSDKKILIVYYSASGSTERVAKEMANNLNADLFEIEPKDEYTSDDLNWSNSNSRVSREHNDESLRNVELKTTVVNNFDSYDTVLIGYPIWWGIAAWPVDTFVKNNDFTNKTVIPFCTSASSGLGQSGKLLENEAKGGNWQEGHRFSSSASSSNIKEFTDSIN